MFKNHKLLVIAVFMASMHFIGCASKSAENVKLLETLQTSEHTTKFEYDAQHRLVKLTEQYKTISIEYQDNGSATVVIDYPTARSLNETTRYERNGNTITIHTSTEYDVSQVMTLDKNEQITKLEKKREPTHNNVGWTSVLTFIYTQGNLMKVTTNSTLTGEQSVSFKYDDQKATFLHCKTPKWLLYSINQLNYFHFGVNNLTEIDWGFEKTNHEYEYDNDGFPVKRISKIFLATGDEMDEMAHFTYIIPTTDPIPPVAEEKSDSLKLPANFVLFEEIIGDLSGDGITNDKVLIVKATDNIGIKDPEETSPGVDRNRRGIIVYFKEGEEYVKKVENLRCFASENEFGGVYFAPELEVSIKNGDLIITYGHGRYGFWRYTFRYINNEFVMITYDRTVLYQTAEAEITNIDFLSKKAITRTNINENAESGQEVYRDVHNDLNQTPMLRLSEIKDFGGDSNDVKFGQFYIYNIGDKGPSGGIIFYDKGSFTDGWQYLEAVSYLYEFEAEWGLDTVEMTDTGEAIGAGKRNTEKIVAALNRNGETGKAAQLCANLDAGGYQDWFLPSWEELILMYRNLFEKGLGDFKSRDYWSSSHVYETGSYNLAFYENYGVGYARSQVFTVRAVRAF